MHARMMAVCLGMDFGGCWWQVQSKSTLTKQLGYIVSIMVEGQDVGSVCTLDLAIYSTLRPGNLGVTLCSIVICRGAEVGSGGGRGRAKGWPCECDGGRNYMCGVWRGP